MTSPPPARARATGPWTTYLEAKQRAHDDAVPVEHRSGRAGRLIRWADAGVALAGLGILTGAALLGFGVRSAAAYAAAIAAAVAGIAFGLVALRRLGPPAPADTALAETGTAETATTETAPADTTPAPADPPAPA